MGGFGGIHGIGSAKLGLLATMVRPTLVDKPNNAPSTAVGFKLL